MAKPTIARIFEMVTDNTKTIDEHDKILIRGNGEPSLLEEVRTIKRFMERLQFWLTAFGIAFLGQGVITLWYLTTHLVPIVERTGLGR